MDLKRLRTFVAVAELGTVSRAALGLRISQSALSRQISELEQEFGFKLFDRVGRRLILTAIGEQLLGDCRDVLGHVGSLGERVDLLRRGDRGVLKVAAPPLTIESILSRFLPRYAQRFPNVQVKLTENTTTYTQSTPVEVKAGGSLDVPVGTPHRIANLQDDDLVVIEVQRGDYLGEDDIVRLEDDYGRGTAAT